MFISFRVVSALAGAGVFMIVGGSLSDMFIPEEKAHSMSFFAATVIMGPCIGPVFGSLIADNLNWYDGSQRDVDVRRWVFHVQTIYAAILLVFVVFALPETYVPKLAQKTRGLTHIPVNVPPLSTRIKVALQRPLSPLP